MALGFGLQDFGFRVWERERQIRISRLRESKLVASGLDFMVLRPGCGVKGARRKFLKLLTSFIIVESDFFYSAMYHGFS